MYVWDAASGRSPGMEQTIQDEIIQPTNLNMPHFLLSYEHFPLPEFRWASGRLTDSCIPHHNFGGKHCDFSADTLFISCWERSIYMYYDALEWWIRTVTEKWSVWVPAIGQTDYHYAVWVILYKPICHAGKVSHVIWFIACNGLGEIYLDFQQWA